MACCLDLFECACTMVIVHVQREKYTRKTRLKRTYPTHWSVCQTAFCNSSYGVPGPLFAQLIHRSVARSIIRAVSQSHGRKFGPSLGRSILHSRGLSADRSLVPLTARYQGGNRYCDWDQLRSGSQWIHEKTKGFSLRKIF